MKYLSFTTVFFVISIIMKAQVFYSFSFYDVSFNYELRNFYGLSEYTIAKENISEIRIYHSKPSKNEQENKELVEFYQFNDYGKTIRFIAYTKKGKITDSKEVTYNRDSMMTEIVSSGSKKWQNYKTTYEYNDNKNTIAIRKFRPDKTGPVNEQYSFYDKKLLTKYEIFHNGKLSRFYIYSYYPDGSRESTKTYNKKGKLTHTTSYACIPVGETVRKHKDSLMVCQYEQYDNTGKIYKITERTHENNKVYKYIDIYTADTVLIENRCYMSDTVLFSLTKYLLPVDNAKKNHFLITENYRFNKKGDTLSFNKNTYNDNSQILKSEYYKRKGDKLKLLNANINFFNEKGLVTKTQSDWKNKQTCTTIEYTFKY